MQQHGFRGLAAHRHDHRMPRKTRQIQPLQHRGEVQYSIRFLKYLQAWWRNHILKTDKEYSEFLNARGVS
jgi:hemerythrin